MNCEPATARACPSRAVAGSYRVATDHGQYEGLFMEPEEVASPAGAGIIPPSGSTCNTKNIDDRMRMNYEPATARARHAQPRGVTVWPLTTARTKGSSGSQRKSRRPLGPGLYHPAARPATQKYRGPDVRRRRHSTLPLEVRVLLGRSRLRCFCMATAARLEV